MHGGANKERYMKAGKTKTWTGRQELKRDGILDFVSKNVSTVCFDFAYSLPSFAVITLLCYKIALDDLEESVGEEINEPGNLLGYLRRPKRSEK